MLLEESDLVTDLAISSVITRKKILNWIQNGLYEYNQSAETGEDLNKPNDAMQPSQLDQGVLRPKTTEMNQHNQVPPLEEHENLQEILPVQEKDFSGASKQYQLIVIPNEQVNSSQYCLDQKGGSIGRQHGN